MLSYPTELIDQSIFLIVYFLAHELAFLLSSTSTFKLIFLFFLYTGSRGSGKHTFVSLQFLKYLFKSNFILVPNLYYSKKSVSKWIWTSDSNCTNCALIPLHHDSLRDTRKIFYKQLHFNKLWSLIWIIGIFYSIKLITI